MDDLLLAGCRTGDLAAVATALRNGADLHCYGDGPLLTAAVKGHYNIVQHLWLHAEVPRHFHVGQGTLRRVAERGHADIAAFLAPYATSTERAAAVAAAHRKGREDVAARLADFDRSAA